MECISLLVQRRDACVDSVKDSTRLKNHLLVWKSSRLPEIVWTTFERLIPSVRLFFVRVLLWPFANKLLRIQLIIAVKHGIRTSLIYSTAKKKNVTAPMWLQEKEMLSTRRCLNGTWIQENKMDLFGRTIKQVNLQRIRCCWKLFGLRHVCIKFYPWPWM